MSKFTDQLNSLWTWCKTYPKALFVGAVVGAVFDDPLIALIQTIL